MDYWYGCDEKFDVVDHPYNPNYYIAKDILPNKNLLIRKEDCEIIKEEKNSCTDCYYQYNYNASICKTCDNHEHFKLFYTTRNCGNYNPSNGCIFKYSNCRDCHLNKIEKIKSCQTCYYGYQGNSHCNNCNNYSKHKKQEEIKMRKVVKEIPNQEMIVTYDWLKEQKACQDGLDWFVNTFGNKEKYEKIMECFNNAPQNCKIYNNTKLVFDKTWRYWLEQRKHLLQNKDDVEYVTIDKVDILNKTYIFKENNEYYLLIYSQTFNYTELIDLNNHRVRLECGHITTFFTMKDIYEFDSFDDFIKWYQQNKK